MLGQTQSFASVVTKTVVTSVPTNRCDNDGNEEEGSNDIGDDGDDGGVSCLG